jgi:hypothetical protein
MNNNDRLMNIKFEENKEMEQIEIKNINLQRSERIKKTNKYEIINYSENNKLNNNKFNMILNNTNQSKEKDENYKNSEIFKHGKEKNHGMDWEGSQVIWSDNSSNKLLVKESLIIKAYESELNRTTHSVPLYVFPDGLPKHYLPKFTS